MEVNYFNLIESVIMQINNHTLSLNDRGIVRVTGEDAKKLLDGILTCDLDRVTREAARFGGLLSPQGKILFDFIISAAADGDGYYLDCPLIVAADFARRLNFYKLRAKVKIENVSDAFAVIAHWGEGLPARSAMSYLDPRLTALGTREIKPRLAVQVAANAQEDMARYNQHRIALGVPDIGLDFGLGDVFPHEMLMDQLAGVDFDKGCYIGQEVVSRMQHRGSARSRVMQVRFSRETAPQRGSEITAGGKVLGKMGSSADGLGLALLRLDRASDALAKDEPILAEDIGLAIFKPAFARFDFPLNVSDVTF